MDCSETIAHGVRVLLPEMTQAVMRSGSALLYTGRVLHGGGENYSHDTRYGIHMSCGLAQMRPEEASLLMVPWGKAQHLPERVQHILGYYSHKTVKKDWTSLWAIDYNETRNAFEPSQTGEYKSHGANVLPSLARKIKDS